MIIDWDELHSAFTFFSDTLANYLDLETGKILLVSEMDPDCSEVSEEELDEHPDRYVYIETHNSNEAYEWMVAFAESVDDRELFNRLDRALNRSKPFRRFKDVLEGYPRQEEEWYAFEDQMLKRTIEEWVSDEGLKPENPPPWKKQ